MEEFSVMHIVETTPPNCSTKLYSIVFNGETLAECMSLDEVKDVKIGELIEAYYEDGRL